MKLLRLALCGLLASTTAYAQNPPPTEPPAGEPAPPPVETPPAPPPVVEAPPPVKPEVVAAPKPAEDGDDKYRDMGLLFNLNNVFVQPGVLGGWQGFGLGVQKKLANGRIARLGLELARITDPVNIVKTTQTNGMMVIDTYSLQLPGSGFSAQHAIGAVLDLVKPLTDRSIAPYLGAGVFVGYLDRRLDYKDDLTVTDQITEVDNSSITLSTGLRGIVGVIWKLNPRFALFAEYSLRLEAIAWQSDHGQTTTTNTASGMPATNRLETESKETRWLNIDLGLTQGGALGLVAHF